MRYDLIRGHCQRLPLPARDGKPSLMLPQPMIDHSRNLVDRWLPMYPNVRPWVTVLPVVRIEGIRERTQAVPDQVATGPDRIAYL